jgi:Glycosyl transferases group 1
MTTGSRVLLVTRIPFWLLGAGERTRLLAMVWVLGSCTRLTLLFLGPLGPGDLQRIRQLKVRAEVHGLPGTAGGAGSHDTATELAAFGQLCSTRPFDVCIFERIALRHLLPGLPAGVRSVLDTHDLESVNAVSRQASGLAVEAPMSLDDELAVLARFDRVLLIQHDDYALVAQRLGPRAMLVPHPVNFAALPVQPRRRAIGLVASAWRANLDGLDWFAAEVWPLMADSGAQMHLFGWIGDHWQPGFTGFERHGFVADFRQSWGALDVAINPVRWGSGLKIKSVEAIGHGLPLVTTSEGARGMLDGAGDAFIVADSGPEFARAFTLLLEDPARRAALGARAHAYAARHFSAQACFGELVRWLNSQ